MSNLTTKKQNRILYGTLVALLAGAATLTILTTNANKKENEKTPPSDNGQIQQTNQDSNDENVGIKEDVGLFPSDKKESDTASSKDEKTPSETTKTHTDPAETVPTVSLPESLPSFQSPVQNGVILRAHSTTVPVFSPTMEDYRTHTGMDILCAPSSPILAAADGKIGNVWYDPMMGQTLSIVHSGGAVTVYQGVSEELPEGIKPGADVQTGQVIARSGNTALIECEDEEHLHFMMTVDGIHVDPAEYIQMETLSQTYED